MTAITKLMQEKALPIVEEIYNDDFIQGIIHANISKESIKHYLKADSLYLANFTDIYAMLIAKTKNKENKNFYLTQIDFILNHEIDAHKNLAEYVGEPYYEIIKEGEWYPSADHYIKHMYYNVYAYSEAHTLSAMSPCPWIYKMIANKILENNTIENNHPFKEWIEFYVDGLVDECLDRFDKIINDYAENASVDEKYRIIKNFLESCEHERKFFNMAAKQEKWLLEV